MNKFPINCYRKRQATVEESTFLSDLFSMKAGVDMVENLCYKLQMFGVPIDGSVIVFCDNNALYMNIITL